MSYSTLATILGAAALGLLKKQAGSHARLFKKTDYNYMMYFILIQDGYNHEEDEPLLMETVKELVWELVYQDEEPIDLVNQLHDTLYTPFEIYTPCGKYFAHIKPRRVRPQRTRTVEKIAQIAIHLDGIVDVVFHKENYEPIPADDFNREFWLIKDAIISNTLNKFYSLMKEKYPRLNCNGKWKILDDEWVSTEVYTLFVNQNEYDDLRLFGEEVLLNEDEFSETNWSGWTVWKEDKIYNFNTGEEYKLPEPTNTKLRKR